MRRTLKRTNKSEICNVIIERRLPIFADDEDVTCNVCDRAFCTPRMLDRHKQKKRHWGYIDLLDQNARSLNSL